MFKVITKNYNGVVVAVSDEGEIVESGILMNSAIYAEQGLELQECEQQLVPFKHCLKNGVVSINPEFEITEQAIREKAIDDYTLELIEGGVL